MDDLTLPVTVLIRVNKLIQIQIQNEIVLLIIKNLKNLGRKWWKIDGLRESQTENNNRTILEIWF
jgi:hypothetical protein